MGGDFTEIGVFTYKEVFDYDATTRLQKYHGWADYNTETSEAKWKIAFYEYNAIGQITQITWADAGQFSNVWDDRATLDYK